MAPASSRTKTMVASSLLAALLAASAWVTIPIGPVPITLQVFVVLLAALLLSPGAAAAAVAVYLLLGAAGVPVFSGPSGGIGVLAGPTGGYLIGFMIGAACGSAARRLLADRVPRLVADASAAAVVILLVYSLGWWRLATVTGMGVAAAFAAGVAPFLLVDAAKAVAALAVASALRRAGVAEQ